MPRNYNQHREELRLCDTVMQLDILAKVRNNSNSGRTKGRVADGFCGMDNALADLRWSILARIRPQTDTHIHATNQRKMYTETYIHTYVYTYIYTYT